ncbi:MAG: hypothetical protein C0524_00970, partial [Rhodobacter sp.]|nr:hypothetical protein [Rhodobacter sp.]
MGFIDWLFRRKPKGRHVGAQFRGSETAQIKATKAAIDKVALGEGPADGRFPKLADASPEVLTRTANSATVAKVGPVPAVNIWDMDGEPEPVPVPRPRPRETEAGDRRRKSRTKTRVLGFELQHASVVPLFDEGRMAEEGLPGSKSNVVMFPTGWLVIKEGAGRGAAF